MIDNCFKVEKLNVTIDSNQILNNIDFSSKTGSITCITGVSGIGKTTLLKTVGQIIDKTSGNISLRGNPINNKELKIGYVPQDHGLYSWLKVKSNILLPCKIKKMQPKESLFKEIVDNLGISHLADRYPNNLSGGEKQRVALARGMILNPEILLVDEAFSSLDALSKLSGYNLFLSLHERFKPTTLVITHDLDEALYLADSIVVLSRGECRQLDNKAKGHKKTDKIYLEHLSIVETLVRGEDFDEKHY